MNFLVMLWRVYNIVQMVFARVLRTIYIREMVVCWTPSSDVNNECNVDADWLVLRWRNGTEEDFHYEWWNIECVQVNKMDSSSRKGRWYAFYATFTWHCVK